MPEENHSINSDEISVWLDRLKEAYEIQHNYNNDYDWWREQESEQWQMEPKSADDGPDWELYIDDNSNYEFEDDQQVGDLNSEQNNPNAIFDISEKTHDFDKEENIDKKNTIKTQYIDIRNVWMEKIIETVSSETTSEKRRGIEFFLKDTQAFFALFEMIDTQAFFALFEIIDSKAYKKFILQQKRSIYHEKK